MRQTEIESYRALVAGFDGIEVKGKKTAYTAIYGNMFSFVDSDGGLCLRLSPDEKLAFEKTHGTGPVVQYGAVMKGYVPVPEGVLADDDTLKTLFSKSFAFAKSLKPKPTKR